MKFIDFKKHDRHAEIKLNRPERRNAFHPQMIEELTEAFTDLSQPQSEALRAVVLRAEGLSFCAGADLEWMKSMVSYSHEENLLDSEKLFDLFSVARSCPLPVLGQVHGHVMGGALGLVAICDVVAAEAGTQFCFSEVRLGLVPAVISPFVLEKVNRGRAQNWMLSGELFSAQAALESGLVHYLGNPEEVNSYVEQKLEEFLRLGPEAVRSTKRLLLELADKGSFAQHRKLCPQVIADRRVSPEGQEGLKAFLEKRKPTWL